MGLGSHSLLQRILLTQRSNLRIPHCRQISIYNILSHNSIIHDITGYITNTSMQFPQNFYNANEGKFNNFFQSFTLDYIILKCLRV